MEKNFKRLETNKGAIISTDIDGIIAYRNRKKHFSKFNDIEDRINTIENKLDLLLKAIDGITNTSNT